jgi:DNA-binding XRE family transcriptional regulator
MVSNEKITVETLNDVVYIFDTMTGKELKQARLALNMTQKELGEALELAKNTVAMAERGEIPIRRTTDLAIKYLLVMSKKREGKKKSK